MIENPIVFFICMVIIALAILFIPFFIYDLRRKKKGTYNEFEDVFIGKS